MKSSLTLKIQRTGPYSKKSLDIMNLPLMEMEPALDKLSRDELQEFAGTTKSMAVVWRGDEAEAGSFVEVEGGGGIVTINDVYDAGESGELVFYANVLNYHLSSHTN